MTQKVMEKYRKPGKILMGASIAGVIFTTALIYAWVKYKDSIERDNTNQVEYSKGNK